MVLTDEAGPVAVPAATEELELLTAQGGALTPEPVRPAEPRNLAVTDARYGDGPEGGSVRVRVANFGQDDVEAPVTVKPSILMSSFWAAYSCIASIARTALLTIGRSSGQSLSPVFRY